MYTEIQLLKIYRLHNTQCTYLALPVSTCICTYMYVVPTFLVTPAQLMRPGIGRNTSCALGDCIPCTCRPEEVWFLGSFMTACIIAICVCIYPLFCSCRKLKRSVRKRAERKRGTCTCTCTNTHVHVWTWYTHWYMYIHVQYHRLGTYCH